MIISCILWTFFKNLKCRWILILGCALVISVISIWNVLGLFFTEGITHKIIDTIHFDFRLWNYVFFAIGLFFRYCYEHGNMLSAKSVDVLRSLLAVVMIIYGCLFFNQNTQIKRVLLFLMCIPFLIVVLYDCINKSLPRSKIFEFIGKYSLPIYLYHIFCKQISHFVFGEGSNGYYGMCILLFVLLCVGIFLFRNNKLFGRLFFGIVQKGEK